MRVSTLLLALALVATARHRAVARRDSARSRRRRRARRGTGGEGRPREEGPDRLAGRARDTSRAGRWRGSRGTCRSRRACRERRPRIACGARAGEGRRLRGHRRAAQRSGRRARRVWQTEAGRVGCGGAAHAPGRRPWRTGARRRKGRAVEGRLACGTCRSRRAAGARRAGAWRGPGGPTRRAEARETVHRARTPVGSGCRRPRRLGTRGRLSRAGRGPRERRGAFARAARRADVARTAVAGRLASARTHRAALARVRARHRGRTGRAPAPRLT
jgi:hypothetical protein